MVLQRFFLGRANVKREAPVFMTESQFHVNKTKQ